MHEVLAYLQHENLLTARALRAAVSRRERPEGAAFSFPDCDVIVWSSGRALSRSTASESAAVKGLRRFRELVKASTGEYPRVITYGVVVDGRARLAIGSLKDYERLYEAEIADLVGILDPRKACAHGTDETVAALAEFALLKLIRSEQIDGEYVTLVGVTIDLRRRERAVRHLERLAGEGGSKRVYTLERSPITQLLRRPTLKIITEGVALAVLGNAVYDYIAKPLLQVIDRMFYPMRIAEDVEELAESVPELRYLMMSGPATLDELAAGIGRDPWDCLVILNWLAGREVVQEFVREDQIAFALPASPKVVSPSAHFDSPREQEVEFVDTRVWLPPGLQDARG